MAVSDAAGDPVAGGLSEGSAVAVIGAGTMGNGIAQVFAQSGFATTVIDLAPAQLERASAAIDKSLARLVKKGRLQEDAVASIRGRIGFSSDIEQAAGAALVVEAIVESEGPKRELFAKLDELTGPGAILASNTSSIPITKLGAATGRAGAVIGMHFMNPVPVMQLVEVIRGEDTSDETTAIITATCRQLGKTPVEVNDFPGFVSNRILLPMLNEAFFCVMEGVATPEAIDQVMKLGMNHPIGPLALADLIGLDVCLHILEVLHRDLGDPKYRPCPLLRRMVAAGKLGRKSGRGFYSYDR
jgi:3-hydroxybutyryl-CoA dehydrogenase